MSTLITGKVVDTSVRACATSTVINCNVYTLIGMCALNNIMLLFPKTIGRLWYAILIYKLGTYTVL